MLLLASAVPLISMDVALLCAGAVVVITGAAGPIRVPETLKLLKDKLEEKS